MKIGSIIKRIQLEAPNAGVPDGAVSADYLKELIVQGCNAVNMFCKLYKGYTLIDVEANKRIYDLSTVAPNYLGRDKRGLFFKDSNDAWVRLTPKTEDWMTGKIPNYLNSSSVGIPVYYWISGDELGFQPPASTAKVGGIRLYHLMKTPAIANEDFFPFTGSAKEITAFLPLDEAIISYCLWKIRPSFGTGTKSDVDLGQKRFIIQCRISKRQVRNAPDLSGDTTSGMNL